MANQKFRLVTRSDLDGLICAVLLKELDLIDDIKFVHGLAGRDVQIIRKWGSWEDWLHDSAVITGGGRHYILAGTMQLSAHIRCNFCVHACSEATAWQLGGAVSFSNISRHQFRLASPRTANLSVGLPPVRLHTAARPNSRQRSVFNSHFSNWPSRRCNSTHRL